MLVGSDRPTDRQTDRPTMSLIELSWTAKKSKRIKGGNDHHHENAEHQILARATKFPTGIYLIYMYVKYDFHRKNTVTLDHILAPNLNVQSCRQHQVRKNLQSPPLDCADDHIISIATKTKLHHTLLPHLNVLSCRQHKKI